MAKNYVDNLSEETRKGMQEKAEQGIWPSFAPLGYRNVAVADGKKIIEPDPESAPIISRLFEWHATGIGEPRPAAADLAGPLQQVLQAGRERDVACVDGVLGVADEMGELFIG